MSIITAYQVEMWLRRDGRRLGYIMTSIYAARLCTNFTAMNGQLLTCRASKSNLPPLHFKKPKTKNSVATLRYLQSASNALEASKVKPLPASKRAYLFYFHYAYYIFITIIPLPNFTWAELLSHFMPYQSEWKQYTYIINRQFLYNYNTTSKELVTTI